MLYLLYPLFCCSSYSLASLFAITHIPCILPIDFIFNSSFLSIWLSEFLSISMSPLIVFNSLLHLFAIYFYTRSFYNLNLSITQRIIFHLCLVSVTHSYSSSQPLFISLYLASFIFTLLAFYSTLACFCFYIQLQLIFYHLHLSMSLKLHFCYISSFHFFFSFS